MPQSHGGESFLLVLPLLACRGSIHGGLGEREKGAVIIGNSGSRGGGHGD